MKRGDIVQLGPHRLMCGDCTDKKDIDRLFGLDKASLLFTSPPYLKQRDYGNPAACWTTMMIRALENARITNNGQILINLGLIHHGGQYVEYWQDWILSMQRLGWRKFGWYVWDKLEAIPGNRYGRLSPSFEFIFHLNKTSRRANKIVPCIRSGSFDCRNSGGGFAGGGWKKTGGSICSSHKILDGTIRLHPEKKSRFLGSHPAMFPVSLPQTIYQSWTSENELVYDPFVGSGTSIIAADSTNRICLGMELNETYCDIVIERYKKHAETSRVHSKPKRKVVTA